MTLAPIFILWMVVTSPNHVEWLPLKAFTGQELCESYARAYNRAEKDVWVRFECRTLEGTNEPTR